MLVLILKRRELELKERKAESEIKEIDARSVQIGVQAAYSAMQAGVTGCPNATDCTDC